MVFMHAIVLRGIALCSAGLGASLVALVCCCVSLPSHAASARIGFLSPTTAEGSAFVLDAFRQGLREHGYVEGTNVTIETRYAHDRFERLPQLSRELVALPVDVLVSYVTQASIAAKHATQTIPIVMIGVSDPIASGLVSSLSRPGANITGTSGSFTGMAGKGVQLLKEAFPGLTRIAVLWNPANRVFQAQMLDETRAAGRQLGIELELFEATDPPSIDAAFTAISKRRVSAVSVLPDPVFAANWSRIAALAIKGRLLSVTVSSAYADAGGLMAYGPSLIDLARTTAGYVAKILAGAKPGELPIERPGKYELVINLKTAKQIGATMPQPLRLRADRLIE
jgi:putative ABC transport system substrate-binding protein